MKSTVKSRLEDLLKSSNLSEYELAKRSGIEYTTVHRILTGDTASPSKNTLAPIARTLNVSLEFLHRGIQTETELSLLQRALAKLEEQIDKKDAMIERLMNKLMGPDSNSFRRTRNGTAQELKAA